MCRPRLTPSVQRRLSGPCAVKNTHKTLIFLTFIKHTTVRIEGEKDTQKISLIGIHVGLWHTREITFCIIATRAEPLGRCRHP